MTKKEIKDEKVIKRLKFKLFLAIVTNPFIMVPLTLTFLIVGIYAYKTISTSLQDTYEQYMNLTKRYGNSKKTFGKRLEFLQTMSANGQLTVMNMDDLITEDTLAEMREAGYEPVVDADTGVVTIEPTSGGSGSSTPPGGYEKAIIDWMKSAGYNDYAIAGALGNFLAESHGEPIHEVVSP